MSELFSQNGINCSIQVTAAVGTEFRSVIPYHAKCDFWVWQCDFLNDLADCVCFGHISFHEFFPNRNIVKQVADQKCCPVRTTGLFQFSCCTAGNAVAGAEIILFSLRQYCDFCHCCNGSQSLTAKAQCENVIQIGFFCNFTGGVTEKSSRYFLRCHAAAVIYDSHVSGTAMLNFHCDVFCSGIDCIFHHFFDNRRRTLNDFSGGNQFRNFFPQNCNIRHYKHLLSKRYFTADMWTLLLKRIHILGQHRCEISQ